MARRETVALRLFLPPSDHLPPLPDDGAGAVLQQHPAQHVNRGQLTQPGRRRAVIDRLQQRVPVFGVSDRQLIAAGPGDRGPPGGHRGAVPAGGGSQPEPPPPPHRGGGRPRPPRPPPRRPRCPSRAGAAAASASIAARPLSPASSSRFSAATTPRRM